MTDNQTTELRELLTERGIEWRSGLEGVTFVGDWCFVEYEGGKLAATCEPTLTPEQAIAATLGGEHAERTCKVVSSYYYDDYDQYEFEFSCGHLVNMYDKEPPNYCPNCGAKVLTP